MPRNPPNNLRIALLQNNAPKNLNHAHTTTETHIRQAAAQGAQIICTQELFTSPYFCTTQNPHHFNLAQTIPGPTTKHLAPLAAELNIVLILSLFEKRTAGIYHNTAAIIDADGTLLGTYRKNHIPQDPSFEEKYYFTPSDTGYKTWHTRHGKIGIIICWDQWFPEAARLTALQGADIIFAPSAIGKLDSETQPLADTQHHAWQTIQQSHAIANACYIATTNRTGHEPPITFWGQSFISDYMGKIIAQAPPNTPHILYADCDLNALEKHRQNWPFFRDRRTDTYSAIQKKCDDA